MEITEDEDACLGGGRTLGTTNTSTQTRHRIKTQLDPPPAAGDSSEHVALEDSTLAKCESRNEGSALVAARVETFSRVDALVGPDAAD